MSFPPIRSFTLAFMVVSCCLSGCATQGGQTRSQAKTANLPVPINLSFRDFFKLPVGPYGLEPTPKLLAANGKRVQVNGYIVQEEEPVPGLFMVTATPTFLTEVADGPADYLPPATLFVHLPPTSADKVVKYLPGQWNLVGTLQVGGQEEANGRVSHTRLIVDDPALIKAPDGHAAILTEHSAPVHHH